MVYYHILLPVAAFVISSHHQIISIISISLPRYT